MEIFYGIEARERGYHTNAGLCHEFFRTREKAQAFTDDQNLYNKDFSYKVVELKFEDN